MDGPDRTIVSALVGASALVLIMYAIKGVSWDTPRPLIVLLPTLTLAWIALYNIAQRR